MPCVTAPGLLARLVAAVALTGLVQFAATYEIARIVRVGQMTPATAIRDRLYVAAFLMALLLGYGIRLAARQHGGVSPNPSMWTCRWTTGKRRGPGGCDSPDLTLAFGTAGVSAVVALLWASAYQLLVSLGPSQLRYASVQSAFHGLLQIMDFSGPVYAPPTGGTGMDRCGRRHRPWRRRRVHLGGRDLGSEDWSRATTAACEQDAGQPDNDMIDLLDYGVQLSLLRRVEGRYSFYHPRLLEFFSDGRDVSTLRRVTARQSTAKRNRRPVELVSRRRTPSKGHPCVLTRDDRCGGTLRGRFTRSLFLVCFGSSASAHSRIVSAGCARTLVAGDIPVPGTMLRTAGRTSRSGGRVPASGSSSTAPRASRRRAAVGPGRGRAGMALWRALEVSDAGMVSCLRRRLKSPHKG